MHSFWNAPIRCRLGLRPRPHKGSCNAFTDTLSWIWPGSKSSWSTVADPGAISPSNGWLFFPKEEEKRSWSLSLRLVYPVLHKPPGATITSRSAVRIRINFWRMVGLYISFGDWANALECWRSPSLRLVIPGIAVSPGVTHSDSRIVLVTGTVVKPQQPIFSPRSIPITDWRMKLTKKLESVLQQWNRFGLWGDFVPRPLIKFQSSAKLLFSQFQSENMDFITSMWGRACSWTKLFI